MLLVQQLHDFLVRTGQTREDFALRISAGRVPFCRSRTANEDPALLANAANHPGRLSGLSAGKNGSAGHDGARSRSS